MNSMNRIGISILMITLFMGVNVSCQNFFWSHAHTSTNDTVVKFGYLYNWYVTTGTGDNSISSSDDWFVPTFAINNSMRFYGDVSGTINGGKAKDTLLVYWNYPNTGASNLWKFSARGSGYRESAGSFVSINQSGYWWASTTLTSTSAYIAQFLYNSAAWGNVTLNKKGGHGIRLIKDATGITDGTITTYTGNDGKSYTAVAVNQYYWITENLIETKYRDGTSIPEVTDNTTWSGLTTGARCSYDNDETNAFTIQ